MDETGKSRSDVHKDAIKFYFNARQQSKFQLLGYEKSQIRCCGLPDAFGIKQACKEETIEFLDDLISTEKPPVCCHMSIFLLSKPLAFPHPANNPISLIFLSFGNINKTSVGVKCKAESGVKIN